MIFIQNTTLRWSCRSGDYLYWIKFNGGNSFSSESKFEIEDVWKLKDGDFVTITNRYADLPEWFILSPLEASGALALKMLDKFNESAEITDPMEAPNIWKVFSGDRLIWIGPRRNGVNYDEGTLEIVCFKENALVYGEPIDDSALFTSFGEITEEDKVDGNTSVQFKNALKKMIKMGMPRTINADYQWRIG